MVFRRKTLFLISAVFLIFTKEFGIILFGILVAGYWIFVINRQPITAGEKIGYLKKRWYGIIPFLFSFYI